jgi:four helix bundle protein
VLTVMLADELRARTRQFALDVILLCAKLPLSDLTHVVRPQLIRSATGVAANYRAACRGCSSRELAARLAVVVEEADERELWLDVLSVDHEGPPDRVASLQNEAVQLRAIMARSRSTTLANLRQSR